MRGSDRARHELGIAGYASILASLWMRVQVTVLLAYVCWRSGRRYIIGR